MARLLDEPWTYNYNSLIPPREDPVAFTARRMPARLVVPNGKSFLGIRPAKASSATVTQDEPTVPLDGPFALFGETRQLDRLGRLLMFTAELLIFADLLMAVSFDFNRAGVRRSDAVKSVVKIFADVITAGSLYVVQKNFLGRRHDRHASAYLTLSLCVLLLEGGVRFTLAGFDMASWDYTAARLIGRFTVIGCLMYIREFIQYYWYEL